MASITVSKTVDKGSSPLTPAKQKKWILKCSAIGRASDFGSEGCGFESRHFNHNVELGEWLIHQSAKLTTLVRIQYSTPNVSVV